MTRHKKLISSLRWLFLATFGLCIATGLHPARADVSDVNKCLKADTPGCTFGLPSFQYETLLGQMLAYPAPVVTPIEIDSTELGRIEGIRLIGGIAPTFDGPDGKPTGAINADFNPLKILKQKGDWVEIYPGRWTQRGNITSTGSSPFSGVLFTASLAYPMAWIVVPTRPTAIPGVEADPNTPMIERYRRVNIFATVTIDEWDWYLVGPGQWIEQRRVARVNSAAKPDGVKGRWIAVDLYDQVLTAYEDNKLVYATLISTGMPKPGFGTNKGLFRIWARLKSDRMSGGMGGPDFYDLPNVPYVMYYDESISLHGAYWHDSFGYRHSHGCVNMAVTDAHWLYDWTSGFYTDTWVYVYTTRDYIKTMPAAA